MTRVLIEVLVCRAHGFHAIAINGTLVTSAKCCGSWQTQRSYEVDPASIASALPVAS